MELLERVCIRLKEENAPEDILLEILETICDRICLRVGESSLPRSLSSLAVDAAVKMYRRQYYEGIISEGADTINTTFVEDLLAEYQEELEEYKRQKQRADPDKRVRFL